ncbi:transcriptional regulator with XRE-family HTH domain [Kitasatospora sp. MAA19]|uniref:helix-turn-helix domain-containing protein n=1 Tax=Kitasatospora sp. MAA19 TaxID=3035090 RepID=UPI002473EA65|nr:helix-turn-helix transcriptional regulator [Kitasatospora sp. MAA19]MDH6711373.1 transcriptional regulator with XRE-family HTH domain [Kitasatospora sp. MAA19]
MSTFPYGFDAAKLRAARTAAGASVARIAREVGVTKRAVSLYLAGSRVPRPELLPGLAKAVGVAPADLCTIEQERLVHLRVFAGRSRAEMARALGIAGETYRQLETTGRRGTRAHYDRARDEWIAWDDWAAPAFGTTPERLLAALRRTEEYWPMLREQRWQRIRAADPQWAAKVERMLKRAPRRPGRRSGPRQSR